MTDKIEWPVTVKGWKGQEPRDWADVEVWNGKVLLGVCDEGRNEAGYGFFSPKQARKVARALLAAADELDPPLDPAECAATWRGFGEAARAAMQPPDPRTAPEGVPMRDLWPLKPGDVVEVVATSDGLSPFWPVGRVAVADDDGAIHQNPHGRWLTRYKDWLIEPSGVRFRLVQKGGAA